MKRKIFGIFFCIFLILTVGIVTAKGINLKRKDIKDFKVIDPIIYDIYVDDDASSDWYDETHVKTIQEGVNNASSKDTVFVYNGTYTENILVNKSLDLIGEDKTTTIISSRKSEFNVITVFADEITICNFTIQNSTVGDLAGPFPAGVGIYSNNTCVMNNIFKNNVFGIKISEYYDISNNEIKNNLLIDNGIEIHGSKNNIVYGNTFINEGSPKWDDVGLRLYATSANNIHRNNFSGHFTWIIRIEERSNKNDIHHNNLNNDFTGKGIFIFNSNLNKIHHNNIRKCLIKAVLSKSTFNLWYRNYWGRPRILPKMMINTRGIIGLIPLVTFDLFPKVFPNEI